jgi:hypothetical protein
MNRALGLAAICAIAASAGCTVGHSAPDYSATRVNYVITHADNQPHHEGEPVVTGSINDWLRPLVVDGSYSEPANALQTFSTVSGSGRGHNGKPVYIGVYEGSSAGLFARADATGLGPIAVGERNGVVIVIVEAGKDDQDMGVLQPLAQYSFHIERRSAPGCEKVTPPACGPESGQNNAEPSTLPPSPQQAPPSTYAMPTPTAVPRAPGNVLSPDADGNVLVQTQTGQTHCLILVGEVDCRAQFTNSPGQANTISLKRDGVSRWLTKTNPLPSFPYITLDYGRTYHAVGWSIYPSYDGTRFTNDGTGHGMFVSIDNVNSF